MRFGLVWLCIGTFVFLLAKYTNHEVFLGFALFILIFARIFR